MENQLHVSNIYIALGYDLKVLDLHNNKLEITKRFIVKSG
jgi:hypothetical protein